MKEMTLCINFQREIDEYLRLNAVFDLKRTSVSRQEKWSTGPSNLNKRIAPNMGGGGANNHFAVTDLRTGQVQVFGC